MDMYWNRHVYNEGRDPKCGCYEREVDTDVGYIDIHLLPTGVAEIYVYNGEWEAQTEIQDCDSIDDAEFRARLWVLSLSDDEYTAKYIRALAREGE